MKRAMEICFWLLTPENCHEDRSYQTTPWWLSNLIKVGFWYFLALITGLLLSQLH